MERYDDPDDPLNGPDYRSGRICVEKGCREPAGTAWSAYWCQKHNAERLRRISKSLAEIGKTFEERGETNGN